MTVTDSTFAWTASKDFTARHLETNTINIVWTMNRHSLREFLREVP